MDKVSDLNNYVKEAIQTVETWDLSNSTTHPWFRGQGRAEWSLTPKIYRDKERLNYYEREMLRDFKLFASNFTEIMPKDDFEWNFLMQHYGMPTRLLDWTESYLVALFFAIENFSDEEDAIVWVLDPWSLNRATLDIHSVPVHSHLFLGKYMLEHTEQYERTIKGLHPVCVRPVKANPRILAQKGTFTIHGQHSAGLEQFISKYNQQTLAKSKEIRLKAIRIDGKKKLQLLKQLATAGITYSVIYPDLDGLSKELSMRYGKDYMQTSLYDAE